MWFDDPHGPYLAAVNDSPGFGWMRLYSRLAGLIQMLFAVFLGWLALDALIGLLHQIAEYGTLSKGIYRTINWHDVFVLTVFSPPSFSGFIGGCGLLGLRPWARRWEIAYLGIMSVAVAGMLVVMLSGGPIKGNRDWDTLTMMFQVAIVFALPYLPFLLTGRPCKPTCKPVTANLDDV